MRRLLAAAVATAAIAGPLAYAAPPSGADILPPVSDTGLSLQVAQATLTSSGATAITWQSAATINQSKDTLIRAQFFNDGTLPQLNATLTINAGGKLDPGFTVDPACSVSPGATSDTVTCSYGTVMGGQAEPFVYLAVQTGSATSVTSSASETAVPDGLVPLPGPTPDNDETGSVTTTVLNQGFAFLTDGQSVSFTSADGNVVESFTVPAGATNGGGVFVHLSEGSAAAATCGGGACYTPMAKADFVQVGGTPAVASNPFTQTVSYPNQKQSCNGHGGPSGCNPIYYLATGVTGGPAPQVPLCTTYSPSGGTAFASHDPCVYSLQSAGSGIVTYDIAVLSDIGYPIPFL